MAGLTSGVIGGLQNFGIGSLKIPILAQGEANLELGGCSRKDPGAPRNRTWSPGGLMRIGPGRRDSGCMISGIPPSLPGGCRGLATFI